MLHRRHDGKAVALRMIAAFEAFKGAVILLLGLALLKMLHKNLDILADRLTRILHLNPHGRLSDVFYAIAERTTDNNLWMLALGSAIYAAARFAEAYGLWHNRAWAQWFALISGGLYLPWEIYALAHHSHPYKWFILLLNLLIIFYMLFLRVHRT